VVGDHAQPDPPLHPAWAAVAASPQSVATSERADAPFAARTPAERRSRWAGSRLARLARQDDLADPTRLRGVLVTARSEAAIGDGQVRRVVEQRYGPIEGGLPQGGFRLTRRTDFVIGDELRLRLLDLHEPAELGRFRQLALADDLGVRLEEANHLAREV